ncbi:MAG: catalase family peroxidase [Rhodospirillales bacterium]|nr:catalase family peroxidase [Rhodospirillales bacterium]
MSAVAVIGRMAVIGGIALVFITGFAYAAGWFSPNRLGPGRIVAALANRGGDPLGHRRNHAKGVCFLGDFQANGAAAAYSGAPMFRAGTYPVIGRFAIAVGDPDAPDIMGRVESMAIRITAPDGEEWRSGMNNSPVFVVSTPAEFYGLTLTQEIDPKTGKPNPAATAHFFATHPNTQPFTHWAKTAPWSGSWADETYNSLDAFRFIDATGHSHLVRWSMVPAAPFVAVPHAALAGMGPDFLIQDLTQRIAQGPLVWHLVITLAAPGDPSNDATIAWPENRTHVDAGTLSVTRVEPEADGPCRDYNYDPTILPAGIKISDDPLLPARSAAYAKSFDLRTAEAADYPHHAQQTGGTPQ